MSSTQTLLEQVLGLPEKERFHVVEALLTSLSSAMDEEEEPRDHPDDPELTEELQRRGEELLANPESALPWSEVQELAKAELKKTGNGPCP